MAFMRIKCAFMFTWGLAHKAFAMFMLMPADPGRHYYLNYADPDKNGHNIST